MKANLSIKRIARRIGKGLQLFVLAVAILILSTIIILQLPAIKQALAQKVVSIVEKRTGHDITLEGVQIAWLDHLNFENVTLFDLQDSVMIQSESVKVNFTFSSLLKNQTLSLDDIHLNDALLRLVRYENSPSLNLKLFLDTLSKKDKSKKQSKLSIALETIEMEQVQFIHKNLNSTKRDSVIDPNHLSLFIESGLFSDVNLWSDTLDLSILNLKVTEKDHGFQVNNFTSNLHMDPNHITFNDMRLETPYSQLGDSMSFSFNHIGNLSQFIDSVRIDISLENSSISTLDLGYFGKVNIDTTFQISGDFSGSVSNLYLKDVRLSSKTGSFVQTSGTLIGLPKLETTFLDLDVKEGFFDTGDIINTIGKYSFGDDIAFQGNFSGFISDFVAYGLFKTDHGTVRSNLNFKIPTSLINATYSGDFELTDFDLSRVVQDTIVGTVDMVASVKGKGLTRENANFFLDARLQDLIFNRYEYDSVIVKGRFRENFYDGSIQISDPNCRITGETHLDLTQSVESITMDLIVDSLHLQQLNWTESQVDVITDLSVEIIDLELDNASGNITFSNTFLENSKSRYFLGNLTLEALQVTPNRSYHFNSSFAEGSLEGTFKPSDVIKDLPTIIQDFTTLLTEERDSINSKITHNNDFPNYHWEMEVNVKDINQVLDFVDIPITISPNSHFEASFRRSKNINLGFLLKIDSMTYKEATVYGYLLEMNASRDTASSDVLAIIQLSSESQRWPNISSETKALFLESVWFNNKIDSRLEIEQTDFKNRLLLNTETVYLQDSILMTIKPSQVFIVDEKWQIEKSNKAVWTNNKLFLEDLSISSGLQNIEVSGHHEESRQTDLQFHISNLSLNNFNGLLQKKNLTGVLNFDGSLKGDTLEPYRLQGYLLADSIVLDDFQIGKIKGSTLWDTEKKQAKFNLNLERESVQTIFLEGILSPNEPYDQLEVDIQFDQARLGLIEPFVGQIFQDIKGQVSGGITVGGPLDAPTFYGTSRVKNGELTFGYTNTTYLISGDVDFDSYEISFGGMDVQDRSNGSGRLFGSVFHENLKNLQVNFYLDFTRMQLLNTVAVDNDLYYGRAYGSGNLNLSGPLSQLNLSATIKSDQGTRVYFPLNSETDVSRSEYISFINPNEPNDDDLQNQAPRQIKSDGMNIDLDLDINSNAYAELIFDAQTGDIIRGRADGDLQFKMNPSGEISIIGGLEIESGAYNFTVPGINKEFQLRNGGTISWSGDPYQGIIDLQATYRQIADLSDWSAALDGTQNVPQNVPFLVVLDLKGAMLQPDISFSIEVAEDATLAPGNQNLQQFLLSTNDREDELSKQVFSLLMLRRLSPQTFQAGTVGQGIQGSVSEILSNQLSYWLSQSNENLEVDIDLTTLNQDAFNTFQYRLAYSFLDGRLRVSGGNSLNNQNNNNNNTLNQNNNALIGNWSVEYLLTEDGIWRAKVFSRANQNLVASTDATNNQQTGISLQFVRSFDQFKELVSTIREEENPSEKQNARPSEKRSNTPSKGN